MTLYRADGTVVYSRTEADVMTFSGLLFARHQDKKTIVKELNKLLKLTVPDPKTFQLPRVNFAWGSRTFGAAVIDGEISWDEQA